MPVLRNAGSVLFALLCSAGVSSAQEPEESAREAVEQDLLETQRRESERSDSGAVIIPFEQILAAPENIQLNIAYARQQIAEGDLKEAGATLERILLIDPTMHDVRVLYGLVLYRLGLYDRARYELELALEADNLPPTLRAEAETYLNRIKYEQRTTRGSLTLTTGLDWDRNRNQAPSSGNILFADIPLPSEARNGDAAFIFSARGQLVHDLGTQEGHTLHADVTYYHSDKHEVDRLDLDATSIALGGTFYSGNWSFTPRLRGGFYWLAGEDYLATYGGELEVAYRWNPQVKSYVTFRGEDEDFRATTNFGSAPLRSGRRLGARTGVAWRFSTTQTFTVEAMFADKKGTVGFESYERYGVNAQHSWLLGRGAFSLLGVWAENSSYDAVDLFVSPSTVRDEWLYRARATVGAPLSFFLPNAPEGVKDINIIAQYEYETVDSNILNFDYKTHKAALLLSKRFAF
jgi:tetratricopeptide (TPR) repeat protein